MLVLLFRMEILPQGLGYRIHGIAARHASGIYLIRS